jgi:hypothetical protein
MDAPFMSSLAALRRKLRALAAVARDPGATPPERANATALKKQLEQRLRDAGAPAGDWTDHAFRLGRRVKAMRKPGAPGSGEGDWTDQARRLGKAVGRGYRKWLSD